MFGWPRRTCVCETNPMSCNGNLLRPACQAKRACWIRSFHSTPSICVNHMLNLQVPLTKHKRDVFGRPVYGSVQPISYQTFKASLQKALSMWKRTTSPSGCYKRQRWSERTRARKRLRKMDLVRPTIWCRQGNITRWGSTKRETLPPITVADWFPVYGQARSRSGGRKIEQGPQKRKKNKTIYTPRLLLASDIWRRNSWVILQRPLILPLVFQRRLSTFCVKVCELSIISLGNFPWTLQWIKFWNIHFFFFCPQV